MLVCSAFPLQSFSSEHNATIIYHLEYDLIYQHEIPRSWISCDQLSMYATLFRKHKIHKPIVGSFFKG